MLVLRSPPRVQGQEPAWQGLHRENFREKKNKTRKTKKKKKEKKKKTKKVFIVFL